MTSQNDLKIPSQSIKKTKLKNNKFLNESTKNIFNGKFNPQNNECLLLRPKVCKLFISL